MNFHRTDPSRPRSPRLIYEARFPPLNPDLALEPARIGRSGLTIATMAAPHAVALLAGAAFDIKRPFDLVGGRASWNGTYRWVFAAF